MLSILSFGFLSFTSLFTIIDPLGVAPVFVAMTEKYEERRRRNTALKACAVALAILVVFAVVKTDLSEVKPNSYIGVTAMPDPDGTQRAIAVHIFPETQRGAAEGFRPWDARPNSTMTNATVAETVKGIDGQNILVKYKDGEKKVVVPPDTPIVTFVASDKSEIKPGAKLIIFGAAKKDDGTLEANRVNVGRDGITPPM